MYVYAVWCTLVCSLCLCIFVFFGIECVRLYVFQHDSQPASQSDSQPASQSVCEIAGLSAIAPGFPLQVHTLLFISR